MIRLEQCIYCKTSRKVKHLSVNFIGNIIFLMDMNKLFQLITNLIAISHILQTKLKR